MRIEDGGGENGFAKVDNNQKLEVASESASILYHKSKDDAAVYFQYSKRTFAAAATNEGIFYFEYTGEGTCVIHKVFVTAKSPLGAKIELYVDSAYTSGGTLRTAVNLNRASSLPSDTTCYISDASETIMTHVSANEIADIRLQDTGDTFEIIDFDGALRLKKGNTLAALGEVGAIGDKVRVEIFFSEEA